MTSLSDRADHEAGPSGQAESPVIEHSISPPASNSYSRMLKSSAMLGGAQVINIGLGALRTKVLAVQLGPNLFGVMGLYVSFTGMMQSVASLGLGQSAVRDLAAAAGSGDEDRLARTIIAYRRIVLLTGLLGLVLTVAFALPASRLTFKNNEHVWAIVCLSLTVFFAEVQAGQMALLQGLRRIGDLSAISALGALFSTIFAIPILLILKERGIVPFLICVATAQLAVSWLYARRVKIKPVRVTWSETFQVLASMLHLGLSFVLIGLSTSASIYGIRLVIGHVAGEGAVGVYQAAYTVSGIYIGFVLTAMAGDFYPRLAGYGDDVGKQNQLVNEQTKLALLLATPALIAALAFSGPLIRIMYSAAFSGASEILRWQILGLLGKIISWPMGFILLARRDSKVFLASELITNALHVGLVWIGISVFGVSGVGIAFAVLYACYVVSIYVLVSVRHGFIYQRGAWHVIVPSLAALGLAFAVTFIPSLLWRSASGLLLLGLSGVICLEALSSLIPDSRPARWWRFARDRLVPLAYVLRVLSAGYHRWTTRGQRRPVQ
jgi:PST family polysaccharide transporter